MGILPGTAAWDEYERKLQEEETAMRGFILSDRIKAGDMYRERRRHPGYNHPGYTMTFLSVPRYEDLGSGPDPWHVKVLITDDEGGVEVTHLYIHYILESIGTWVKLL